MKDIILLFSLIKTLKDDVNKMLESNQEITNIELPEYIFNRIDEFKKLK